MRSRWLIFSLALLLAGAHMAAAQDSGSYGSILDRPDRHPFSDRTADRNSSRKARAKPTVEERLLPKAAIAPTPEAQGSAVVEQIPSLKPSTYSAHPDRADEPLAAPRAIPAIWNAEPVNESTPFVIETEVPEYTIGRSCRARSQNSPFGVRGAASTGQSQTSSSAAPQGSSSQRGAKDTKTSRAKS